MFIVIGFLITSLRNVSSTDFALLEIFHERERNNRLFRREANPLGLFRRDVRSLSEGVPQDTPALKDSLRSRIYPLGNPLGLFPHAKPAIFIAIELTFYKHLFI